MTRPMHIRHCASFTGHDPSNAILFNSRLTDMAHSSPFSLCVKHASALTVLKRKQTRQGCSVSCTPTHLTTKNYLLTLKNPPKTKTKNKQHEMKVRYKHYCGKPWSAGNLLSATSTLASLFGAAVVALYSLRN